MLTSLVVCCIGSALSRHWNKENHIFEHPTTHTQKITIPVRQQKRTDAKILFLKGVKIYLYVFLLLLPIAFDVLPGAFLGRSKMMHCSRGREDSGRKNYGAPSGNLMAKLTRERLILTSPRFAEKKFVPGRRKSEKAPEYCHMFVGKKNFIEMKIYMNVCS